jgi:hypothetical protein
MVEVAGVRWQVAVAEGRLRWRKRVRTEGGESFAGNDGQTHGNA